MNFTIDKTQMKYLAIMFMVLDHFAEIVLYSELHGGGALLNWLHLSVPAAQLMYRIFTALGSFTGAVMIYFMVEGYHYTRSFKHYLLRFLICGIISEPVFLYAFNYRYQILNMMFALAISLITVYVHYHVLSRELKTLLYIILFLANAFTDWTSLAVPVTILFVSAFEPLKDRPGFKLDKRKLRNVWFISILYFIATFFVYTRSWLKSIETAEGMILAAIFILRFYDGKRKSTKNQTSLSKKFHQYLLYAIYPLHLLIIAATYYFIIKNINIS